MNDELGHVIITRFNVRFSADPVVKSRGVDRYWLESRFDLFEKYCVPSILGQTSQSFVWLLLFDEDTPQHFIDRAKRAISGRPNSKVVLGTTFPLSQVVAEVKASLPPSCQWLLTTRLDNDDGLHADFIRTLQEAVVIGKTEVLNYPFGIIAGNARAYSRRDDSNAFISLSEPPEGAKTVLSISNHKYASDAFRLRQLTRHAMWLQVVHDGNISNRVRGVRISLRKAVDRFPVLGELDSRLMKEDGLGILRENLLLLPVRSLRDAAAIVVRRGGRLLGFDIHRRIK